MPVARIKSTRERRLKREEFVKDHKDTIQKLIEKDSEIEQRYFVLNVVLNHLEYGDNIQWIDVWEAIKRSYRNLFLNY